MGILSTPIYYQLWDTINFEIPTRISEIPLCICITDIQTIISEITINRRLAVYSCILHMPYNLSTYPQLIHNRGMWA